MVINMGEKAVSCVVNRKRHPSPLDGLYDNVDGKPIVRKQTLDGRPVY